MAQLRNEKKFLEDPPAQFDGFFRWDYLNGAFQKATNRDIKFMDIDGHVEIGGHHLMVETKDEGVEIPVGQKNALLAHWAKGYTTVIFLIGKDEPIACEVYYPKGLRKRIDKSTMTRTRMYDICYRWAKWADANKCPFQYAGE